MVKKLIALIFAGVLGLAYVGSAFAYFHLWRIHEIYTNADGSVQYIELICAPSCATSETQATLAPITVTPSGGSARTFNFPSNLGSAPVLNKTLLIATPGFSAIAGVTPDYTMTAGFVAINGGQMNLGGFHIITYPALPTNGLLSISDLGAQATNTPTNFAGVAGAVPALALNISKAGTGSGTVTSSPAGIDCGATCSTNFGQSNPITLTATPDAGSSFTSWSGACTGSGGCTVTMDAAKSVTASFAAADSQAPTVPAGLSATAISSVQINLAWSAATDAVGVTAYPVFRDGVFLATVNAPTTSLSDTSLAPATLYSYTVAACDAAGNCSAQSGSASATTLASGFTPVLASGFNLIGNSLNTTLDVMAIFGNQDAPVANVTSNIISVWKWNTANGGRWAFHSPQFTTAANAAYAASKNYDVLSTIGPGAGYWVNAVNPLSLPVQNGTNFNWNSFSFSALTTGYNLIAHAAAVSPSQFNNNVSETPPSPGVIPTNNFDSLWAWDATARTWYFYSPSLESSGGLPAVKAYCDSHFYRHFQDYGKTLGIGTGFWVNRP